jgi:hypothetical protein
MNDIELNKIVDFIQKYAPQYKDREVIKQYVLKHFEYKTAFVGYDSNNDVIFVCRWNLSNSGIIAHILDLYIREDYRNQNIIQLLLTKGIWNFPTIRYISFERGKKYPNREQKIYSVERILKRSK